VVLQIFSPPFSLTLLFMYAISSLSIFGIIGAGWASNSKYAVLGALRSAAQMISYEVSLGFIFVSIVLVSDSLNLSEISFAQRYCWNFYPLVFLCFIFGVIALAETNRAPFDLPEAEAEIVAGYNVEYSAILFALFFLGEYSNMFIMSVLLIVLFFGGVDMASFSLLVFAPDITEFFCISVYIFLFCIKVCLVSSLFIFVRAALPRIRYDQLMYLGWQVFLPFTLGFIFCIGGIFYLDDLFFYWGNLNYIIFFDLSFFIF
jgi:NADH-quinone oxidoreductase subunit H